MNLPTTIGNVPTLGYLVTFRLKENLVDISDYNKFLDGLEASKEFSSFDIDRVRVTSRKPSDVYSSVMKKVERRYDDAGASTRYFFRKPKAANGNRTARQLIQETYLPGVKKPTHISIGELTLNPTTGFPTAEYYGELRGQTCLRVSEICQEVELQFDKESCSFPSATLRGRFNNVIGDCLPIAYDAEHLFRFVFTEHRASLLLLQRVVDFLNEAAGTASESRSKRSEISILPLPDIDELRKAVKGAYKEEVADIEASIQEALEKYADSPDPAKLVPILNKIKGGMATLKHYDSKLQQASGGVRLSLQKLRQQTRVLLGRDEQQTTRHSLTWPSAKTRLPEVQWTIGDQLIQEDQTFPVIRSHMESLSWRKGFGEAATVYLVQTDLENSKEVQLTVPSKTLPKQLDNLNFKKTFSGWTYAGDPTTIALPLIVWWRSL